ncbi:MAG: bifunctional phosphoribosylaminoimidazolecarboxamide formyltransferase/IMP cyclohydrolase [Patescibacteria group bacterium]|nr:bifunctional phosphoribosylaminoimidazolecarboxamide formyltransferase/IMP cyclohydrolase [Patescibacteria group bacterium]
MQEPDIHFGKSKKLRYGENPHQRGWYIETDEGADDPLSLQKFEFQQGKELSYNNYLDMDAALLALSHLGDLSPTAGEAAVVIVKHGNPCGASLRENIAQAYEAAWYGGDPLAAFGGVMAVNKEIDGELAEKMIENFFEILMAPSIRKEAAAVFAKKPNLRVLINTALRAPKPSPAYQMHKVRGGMLVTDPDSEPLPVSALKAVTMRPPTEQETEDLLFAWALCRSSKSNTITAAKGRTLIASGVGQQDRKRCAELCVSKAGERMRGAVAASDAFFPFRDTTDVLLDSGVTAIIQPGGSIKDQESIDACNEAGAAMAFTGRRAFRH